MATHELSIFNRCPIVATGRQNRRRCLRLGVTKILTKSGAHGRPRQIPPVLGLGAGRYRWCGHTPAADSQLVGWGSHTQSKQGFALFGFDLAENLAWCRAPHWVPHTVPATHTHLGTLTLARHHPGHWVPWSHNTTVHQSTLRAKMCAGFGAGLCTGAGGQGQWLQHWAFITC